MPTLNTLTIASSAPSIDIGRTVNVSTLIVNASAQAMTPVGGATTVSVNTLTVASSAQTTSAVLNASYVAVSTLTVASSAVALNPDRVIQVNTLTIVSSATFPGRISTDLLSADDLALLRAGEHVIKVYGSPHIPDVLWTARINDPAIGFGSTSIAFDTGAGTHFSTIEAVQEVWVGSTPGSNNIAKLRIRSISSGDGGVTGTVTVAQHSNALGDNYYLTFVLDYPIRQLFPYIEGDGTFKKDRDKAYGDENTKPNPVCVAGPDQAFWFDDGVGSLVVDVDLSDSYAIAEGASITSYAAAVRTVESGTVTVSVNSGTGIGTITFPTTGQYWIRFSCTDSNGKTQHTYRLYFVCSMTPGDPDFPLIDFNTFRLTGDWRRGGWTSSFTMSDNADLASIPDGARMVVWANTWYGDTEKSITPLMPDEIETILGGFVMRDNTFQDLDKGAGQVVFELMTPNEMMRRFNFSVSLEVVEPLPDKWWKYEEWLTVGRAIHHLWKEHSTIFETTDVLGLMDNTLRRPYTEFEEGDLYTMADGFAFQRSIRHHMVCDKSGRMHMVPDLQLLTDFERDSIPHIFEIQKQDLTGQISFRREPLNRVAFVKVAGFAWDGTFKTDANGKRVPDAQPYCASAPGFIPAYEGSTVHTLDRQTWLDQNHANQIAGRVFAQQNNPYEHVPLNFHGNYLGVFEVASPYWYRLSLQAGDTPRGVVWTDKRLMCRSVQAMVDATQGAITIMCEFEAENAGVDGVEGWCMDEIPELPGIELPPLEDMPDALMTGTDGDASVYFKPGYEKYWINRLPDGVEDLEADPFWPTRQGSIASNDAIVWLCGTGFIKRSTDALQTAPTDVTPGNPPNEAGDSPAPQVADVTFVRIEGSWIYTGEFCALGTWQNSSGDWRSWLVYTYDDGDSWEWWPVGYIDNSCFISSIGSDTAVSTATSRSLAWAANLNGSKATAWIANNKIVIVATDAVANNATIYGYVCDISGVTVTPGPERTLVTGADEGDWFAIGIGNYVIVAYWSPWPTSDPELNIESFFVSGTTITSQDTDVVDAEALDSGFTNCVSLCKMDDDHFAATFSTGTQPWIAYYTLGPGGALSSGPWVATPADTSHALGVDRNIPIRMDDETILIFQANYSSQQYMESLVIMGKLNLDRFEFHSSGSKNAGTWFSVTPPNEPDALGNTPNNSDSASRWISGCRVSPYQAVLVTLDNSTFSSRTPWGVRAYGVELTGLYNGYGLEVSEPTVVAPYSGVAASTTTSIIPSGGDRCFMVAYQDASNYDTFRQGYFTNGQVYLCGSAQQPFPDRDSSQSQLYSMEPGKAFLARKDNSDSKLYAYMLSFKSCHNFFSKALGMSLDKELGTGVYATYWDGSDVILAYHTFPWLDLIDVINYGPLSEFESGAKPFCMIGDEAVIYLYGKITDPIDGSITYLVVSDDYGYTYLPIADPSNWGELGYCGAIWVEPTSEIVAAQNLFGSSKLHYGFDLLIDVAFTLPFAGVNPRALQMDPNTGAVYVASDAAQAIMLNQLYPPYYDSVDITYDHGTTHGVKAILLL